MRAAALALALAGCGADETVSGQVDPATEWRLETLHGAPFAARATLRFPAPGEVAGAGPCNRFSARQTVPYPWIAIEGVRATRRACPELDAERRYFEALGAATLAEVSGGVLILTDGAGREAVFRAAD